MFAKSLKILAVLAFFPLFSFAQGGECFEIGIAERARFDLPNGDSDSCSGLAWSVSEKKTNEACGRGKPAEFRCPKTCACLGKPSRPGAEECTVENVRFSDPANEFDTNFCINIREGTIAEARRLCTKTVGGQACPLSCRCRDIEPEMVGPDINDGVKSCPENAAEREGMCGAEFGACTSGEILPCDTRIREFSCKCTAVGLPVECRKLDLCGNNPDKTTKPPKKISTKAPRPTKRPGGGFCGNGKRGNGRCPRKRDCCSSKGYCGRGYNYCGDNPNGTCGNGRRGNGKCKDAYKRCTKKGHCVWRSKKKTKRPRKSNQKAGAARAARQKKRREKKLKRLQVAKAARARAKARRDNLRKKRLTSARAKRDARKRAAKLRREKLKNKRAALAKARKDARNSRLRSARKKKAKQGRQGGTEKRSRQHKENKVKRGSNKRPNKSFNNGSRRSGNLKAVIRRYPDSDAKAPRGVVHVKFTRGNAGMRITYNVRNLERNCDRCGIHIHVGKTCADADNVGGHYWNEAGGFPDPWVPNYGAVYHTNSNGHARGEFALVSGYGFKDNVNHAMVIHAQDGTRVGCGVLRRRR